MGGRSTMDAVAALELTETQRAYIAGFFDGEGSISISYQASNGKPYVQINVSQNRPAVLVWLHAVFGGSLVQEKGMTVLPNGEPISREGVYRWHIGGEQAPSVFLRLMRPFLRVKAQEADEAMHIIRNKHTLTRDEVEASRARMKEYRKPQLVAATG